MKNKIIATVALIGLLQFSCDDMNFIDPKPTRLITSDIALADLDGVEAVVLSAYNTLINFSNYGQRMMLAPDVLADNVELASGTRYTGEIVNTVRSHIDLWNDPENPTGAGFSVRSAYNAYRAINDANIALGALADPAGVASQDPARAAILEGEALFIRALSYHDLARVYSYEPGMEQGGWTQGVVIRTEAVVGAAAADLRARSSNAEVYAQVLQDLTDAMGLLGNEASTTGWPGRASSVAAQALRARVNLYAGNWAAAASDADAALAATSATLTDATNFAASWGATNHPEAIFELQVDAVDWNTVDGVNNSLATVTRSSAYSSSSQGALKASDELLAAYEAGDIRAALWISAGTDYFESTKWQGELGDFRENIPLIRYSELLLIAAEGKARNGDTAGAQADLETLRTNRGLPGTVTASGTALTDLILNERRVELVLEGHRFFDLKRLGLPITKPADLGIDDLLASDFRVLADLNEDYLTINDQADQNPGY